MNALSFQRPMTTTLLALSITVLVTLFPSRATSQLIGIKSVPVATTVNRKLHPKIPNYEIQNIPRDPGDSWAYANNKP